jgi:lysophospholipase L1-like esterase
VAAKSRNAGLADTRAAFEAAAGSDRNALFVDDRVHLSRRGHEVVAETIERVIFPSGR